MGTVLAADVAGDGGSVKRGVGIALAIIGAVGMGVSFAF